MDTAQRLADLTEACAWITDPGAAARILPSFSEDVPGFVPVAGQRADGRPSWPIGCVPALAGPLAAMLATAGLAAARDDGATRVDQLDEDALMADPLVAACSVLLREAAVPGLRAHAAPAVAITWAAPRMLRGEGAQVPGLEADQRSALEPLTRYLSGLTPADRGAALQRVGWEISGRLGAAVASAARSGLPVPAGGLVRSLTTNRLLLAYPRGTLDRQPALDEVAALLGAGLDARLAGAAVQAMSAVLAAVGARQASGSPEGLDLALLDQVTPRTAPMQALLHPVAGPLVLGSLAAFVGAKDLKKAGLDGATAKALLKPAAHRALAAAWSDVRGPLEEWDLLSTLVDRVVPLARSGEGWFGPGGAVRGSARWELLLPGGGGQDEAFVVAVRLTEVRRAVRQAARAVRGLDGAGAVERAWADLVTEAAADVSSLLADHGIAAFGSAQAAVRFALRAAASLSGPREVLAGPRSTRLTVPEGVRVSVGVARGGLRGGTDGERTVLGGDAVAAALGLTGTGALSGRAADRSGLRRAFVGPSGIRSEGVLVADDIAEQMLAGLRQAGAPLHMRGEATKVGGLGDDFKATPVLAWWDAGRGGVVVFVDLDADGAGPVELLALDPSSLATFHAVDQEQARLQAVQLQTGSGAAAEPELEHDPFASEATALFTRPVASPEPAPRPADEPAYEGLEPSNSFMGMGGFGGSLHPSLPGSEPSALGESAARAILDGGDEFTDDEPDDAPVAVLGAGGAQSAVDGRAGSFTMDSGHEVEPSAPMLMDEPEPSAPMLMDEPEPSAPMLMDESEPSAPMLMDESEPSAPMLMDESEPSAPMLMDEPEPSAPMLMDEPEPSAPMFMDEPEPDFEGGSLGGGAFSFSGASDAAEVEIEDDWGEGEVSSQDWAAAVSDVPASREAELDMLHAGAGDDMELVGVAGFSLQGDISGLGSATDPLADPDEFTGFYDASGQPVPAGLVDESPVGARPTPNLAVGSIRVQGRAGADPEGHAELDADAAAQPGRSDASVGDASAVDGAMIAELMRTFRGYVVLEDEGEFTFGLREGEIMRDAHSFDTGGDEAAAYRAFLQAKVDAGFIPRPEQVVALAPGAMVGALDDWRLQHAYEEVSR